MANFHCECSPFLDFSFKSLTSVGEIKYIKPRLGVKQYQRTSSGSYKCFSIRLNNNLLTSADGILGMVYQLLAQPEKLTWLDLSFNRLTSVSKELACFSHLKVLYLHGNKLEDLSLILRPIKNLNQLYSLTLHGNPVDKITNYRTKVLTSLSNVKCLDFTNITSNEQKRVMFHKRLQNIKSSYKIKRYR